MSSLNLFYLEESGKEEKWEKGEVLFLTAFNSIVDIKTDDEALTLEAAAHFWAEKKCYIN